MNKVSSPPAYSLIFAFIIVTVMMLIAATTIQNTTDKIAYYKDLEGGSMAYLAAQSSAEAGVMLMKGQAVGYENSTTSGGAFGVDSDGDGTDETYGDYEIFGNAGANSWDDPNHFYIPIPGTGSAQDAKDCSVLLEDTFVDQACNWNKMLYNQSVTIPLYTDNGSGGLDFPDDLGFVSWELKVRTPCTNGSMDENCDGANRYVLDTVNTGFGGTFGNDDSVILWQITGEGTDSTGNPVTVSVVPDDSPVTAHGVTSRKTSENTEIYESKINAAVSGKTYTVLEANTTSTTPDYSALYQACIGDSDGDNVSDLTLSSLTLQMDIVTPLREFGGLNENIPYLEWQLVMDSTSPFADQKSVIVGKGYHKGTGHTFYYPFVVTRSTTGESSNVYTLSN